MGIGLKPFIYMHLFSSVQGDSALCARAKLGLKIPSALTLRSKMIRPVAATGIAALDDVLLGGLSVGALSGTGRPRVFRPDIGGTVVCGPHDAGRQSLCLARCLEHFRSSFGSGRRSRSPALGALQRHTGACPADGGPVLFAGEIPYSVSREKGIVRWSIGPHPRTESHGLSEAVLRPEAITPRCAEPQRRERPSRYAIQL